MVKPAPLLGQWLRRRRRWRWAEGVSILEGVAVGKGLHAPRPWFRAEPRRASSLLLTGLPGQLGEGVRQFGIARQEGLSLLDSPKHLGVVALLQGLFGHGQQPVQALVHL